MDWKTIGVNLARIGFPVLGGVLGGPAGAVIGKTIAAILGLSQEATPEQVATALGNLSGDQLVALRTIEADLAKAQLRADVDLALGQIEVNKVEAAQTDWFRAGWRPATGWICVFGFAYMTIIRPLVPWILQVAFHGTYNVPPLPPIDTTEIFAILLGILGLGGYRTVERVKGKA